MEEEGCRHQAREGVRGREGGRERRAREKEREK